MDNKELVLNRAKNAIISRDYSLAVRLYTGLLNNEPNNIKYLSEIGSIFVKAGNDAKAIPYFEKILAISPNNFNALNSLGGANRRLGKYDSAVLYLKKALQTGENNAEANYNLGFTYKTMGKTEEAINCFEDVIALNPMDVLAYNHLGSIYADKKDFDKAISSYKRGLQVDPNHPILQYNLARSYEGVKDDGSAVQAYESALKAKPGWQDAVSSYAKLLIAHRKTKVAAEAVRNSIALHPEDADLHNLLGKILILQGDYEQAIATCQKADFIKPNTSDYLNTLATSYEKAQLNEKALETVSKAVKLDERNLEAKKNLIYIQLSSGLVDEAFSNLNQFSEDWQSTPELLNLAGQYYILKNQDSEAENLQKKSLSLDSSYTQSYSDYALRYKQINKFDKAKDQVKNAIDENMKDVSAWILQGQIEEAMGEMEQAEESYSTAMAFDPNNVLAKRLYKSANQKNTAKKSAEIALQSDGGTVVSGTTGNVISSQDVGEEISLDEFGFDTEEINSESEGAETASQEDMDSITDEASEDVTDEFNESLDSLKDEENQDVLEMDTENALFTDMEGDLIQATEEDEALAEAEQAIPEEVEEGIEEEVGGDDAKADVSLVDESDSDEKLPEDFVLSETVLDDNQAADSFSDDFVSEETTQKEPAHEEASQNDEDEAIPEEENNEIEDALDFGNPNFSFNNLYNKSDIPEEKAGLSEEDATMIAESVQDAQNSAQKANEAAEKAWLAAQNAADAAQATDQAENYIREVAETAVEEAASKAVLKHIEKMLPSFEKMAEATDGSNKYEKEIALFKKLREICENLPEPQRTEFLESKTRVVLDYLISRLSGKKGLLKTIDAMNDLLKLPQVHDVMIEDEREASAVLVKKMEEVTGDLTDPTLTKALSDLCEDLLIKL